ncbi:MAG: zinc ribbon domain-containing protein [Acidimicrobiales bacterium]
MAAGPFDLLLEVQEQDLALDRLAHRRATLPERTALAGVEASLARLDGERAEVEAGRAALGGRQERLEQDLDSVVRRIHEVEGRLYGGTVSASRELSAMAEEVSSLQRRRADLEDRVVAVMEEAEPVDAALAATAADRDSLAAEAGRHRAVIAAAETDIDAAAEVERAKRADLAAALPGELATQYERLRVHLGGVGAARLVNGSCTGCHLSLPSGERDRIRHLAPEVLVTCDQCGRILVR